MKKSRKFRWRRAEKGWRAAGARRNGNAVPPSGQVRAGIELTPAPGYVQARQVTSPCTSTAFSTSPSPILSMRFTTYSKYLPGLADAVNLQALLDQLGDFLLQSGFAGGPAVRSGATSDGGDRSLDALRQAILQALMESGQLTPEMLKVLRGESTGDAERDAELERQLAELLDQIVQRLMEEGYLNVSRGAADARGLPADVRPRRARRAPRRSRCSSTSPRRASTSSATRRSRTCWAASASRASARTTRRTSPPASRPRRRASPTSSATR